ncbi:aromatic ring-hydroxylating oxygenase subunit alpha [Cryptosporangium aurantiacum]|uniref:Rieske [2Fe-2S] domain-containing protein n=1 Tax=Cryptosporangium aurantiacum TaxID=134849 RepID=A0A1M7KI14_9ACTN|nr:SRPBCC family protein [Cryptosporangium aurantiacum]SHM64968.1 Rieske [2Fe-2S] domain-containing protein [Cryptosporangium aurantiacum]
MDKEALELSLVRRLITHLDNGTTDLAPGVMEVSTDRYLGAHHEREVATLFHDRPLVFGLSGALPGPDAFRTVDLCGTPILLTRDRRGKVHAFANVCRHRGVRVVDGSGHRGTFACPFHAWVYDNEGALLRVPSAECFGDLDTARHGLAELPVAEGYGVIVGRLRPGPPVDIDEYLGPGLAEEFAVLDFADWEPTGDAHVHRVAANWKVTLDTFRENYHFAYLHRRTLATYAYGGVLTFDAFGPHLRNSSALRSIDGLRGRPEEEWDDVAAHFSYQYALFPNTSLTFDSRHAELWQIVPVDAATSEVWHTSYLRPSLSDAEREKAIEMAPWICETVVDGEDFWVAGRTEPGVRTGLTDHIVFGRNEPAPQHLHREFARALEEDV